LYLSQILRFFFQRYNFFILVGDFYFHLFMKLGRRKLVLTVYLSDKLSYSFVLQIGQMN